MYPDENETEAISNYTVDTSFVPPFNGTLDTEIAPENNIDDIVVNLNNTSFNEVDHQFKSFIRNDEY